MTVAGRDLPCLFSWHPESFLFLSTSVSFFFKFCCCFFQRLWHLLLVSWFYSSLDQQLFPASRVMRDSGQGACYIPKGRIRLAWFLKCFPQLPLSDMRAAIDKAQLCPSCFFLVVCLSLCFVFAFVDLPNFQIRTSTQSPFFSAVEYPRKMKKNW